MSNKTIDKSMALEIIKLKLNNVPIEEISIKLDIPISCITQLLLKNKTLIKSTIHNPQFNSIDLFNNTELTIKTISTQDQLKRGNVYGVERNVKFLYPELGVLGFLNKYYINQKLSPQALSDKMGFGSQKGWCNIVKKYGLVRTRSQSQHAKWSTDRGKRHLDKLKPLMAIIKGQGKRKPLSPKVRWKILEKYEFTCQACGRMPPEVVIEVEHINPISEKGSNDPSNLTVLCDECNIGKYHNEKEKKLERSKKINKARESYKKRFIETYNFNPQ